MLSTSGQLFGLCLGTFFLYCCAQDESTTVLLFRTPLPSSLTPALHHGAQNDSWSGGSPKQYLNAHDIVEHDIAGPQLPEGAQGLALRFNVKLWSQHEKGKYIVPYKTNFPRPQTEKLALWTFRYLESGSNLRFRPVQASDSSWLEFVEFEERCYGSLPRGQKEVYINLSPIGYQCLQEGVVVHEVMHSLGFAHEHQRQDRDKYLNKTMLNLNDPDPGGNYKLLKTRNHTKYDFASVMHYRLNTARGNHSLVPRVPLNSSNYEGHKLFLSSCDWNALNRLYPGKRLPPKCTPGELPDVLEPIDTSSSWLRKRCYVNPSLWFFMRACRLKNGKQFPDTDFIPTKAERVENALDDKELGYKDRSEEKQLPSKPGSMVSMRNTTKVSSTDGDNATKDAADTPARAEHRQLKHLDLPSYCSTFQGDSEESSTKCTAVCRVCRRAWNHNLTAVNMRNCIGSLMKSCHPKEVNSPVKAKVSHAFALWLPTLLESSFWILPFFF